MDLPLITEATNEYYRNIYADPLLGPIFRGINMVVLRQHVSYFIHQVQSCSEQQAAVVKPIGSSCCLPACRLISSMPVFNSRLASHRPGVAAGSGSLQSYAPFCALQGRCFQLPAMC